MSTREQYRKAYRIQRALKAKRYADDTELLALFAALASMPRWIQDAAFEDLSRRRHIAMIEAEGGPLARMVANGADKRRLSFLRRGLPGYGPCLMPTTYRKTDRYTV